MSCSTIRKPAMSSRVRPVFRKIRLGDPTRGKGKRGGARVQYLWLPHRGHIYLVFVYGKNEASTLTADQKKALRAVVAQIKATDSPKE